MVGNVERGLTTIQRNNTIGTRTFGQKLIMFSTVEWRVELHDRILTHFLSPALLFPNTVLQCGGEQRMDPMGLLYLNSYTVRLGPLSGTAQCLLIVRMYHPID